VQITTSIAKPDWVELHLYHQLRNRKSRDRQLAGAFLPPLSAIGLLMLALLRFGPGTIPLSSALALLLILPLYLVLFYRLSRRRIARETNAAIEAGAGRFPIGEITVSISPDGVTVAGPDGEAFLCWEKIPRIVANGDYGYIYTGPDDALIIPQRCFEQHSYFLAFMKTAIFHHWEREVAAKTAAEIRAREARQVKPSPRAPRALVPITSPLRAEA
jgi:hypothetical protein